MQSPVVRTDKQMEHSHHERCVLGQGWAQHDAEHQRRAGHGKLSGGDARTEYGKTHRSCEDEGGERHLSRGRHI